MALLLAGPEAGREAGRGGGGPCGSGVWGPAGLGITPESRPHPLQARALPPRGRVLGHGAQGQGEETLAPAGALTPTPGGPRRPGDPTWTVGRTHCPRDAGLGQVGWTPLPAHPPTRGCHFTLFKQRRLRTGRVSREGDSGPAGRLALLSSGPSGGLLSWKGAEQGALSPALGGSKSPAPVQGSLLSSPHRPTPHHSFQPSVRPESPLPSGREGSPA